MHTCEIGYEHFANQILIVVVAKYWLLVFAVWDRIFMNLLIQLAALKAEDVRASFLFVGDVNGHH